MAGDGAESGEANTKTPGDESSLEQVTAATASGSHDTQHVATCDTAEAQKRDGTRNRAAVSAVSSLSCSGTVG